MFRCKECGTEYEIKPDYCDCGNDTFEEIILQEQPKEENITTQEQIKTEQPQKQETIREEKEQTIKETSQKETKKEIKTSNVQPYAIVIFILCIILSAIVLLFAFNPKPNSNEEKTETTQEITEQNIPSIDKLWNNSTEGIMTYQTKSKQEKEDKISKKKDEAKQIEKKEVKKVTQNQTPANTKKTPPVNNQNNNQNPPKVNSSPNKTVQKPANTEIKVNSKELENYKIKLRNHIASKIAFANVVGDGTCTFSFKVSNSGVLTNKAPVSLSDNDSLNEAVYNALRQIYSYSTPPAGYKNETLKLKVMMYNNSFEVHLN